MGPQVSSTRASAVDGAYATKAWRDLPDRVTVTTRMRANAAVFKLAPPKTGKRGRPALKGARLGSLAQLAATAVFTAVTITGPTAVGASSTSGARPACGTGPSTPGPS